jgi:hypothetical protein
MKTHIDAVVKDAGSQADESRRAKISRTETRGAFGAPVFLTADDLEKLGIDPEETDAVVVRVEEGFVLFDPVDTD